jgi:hypothetical protein
MSEPQNQHPIFWTACLGAVTLLTIAVVGLTLLIPDASDSLALYGLPVLFVSLYWVSRDRTGAEPTPAAVSVSSDRG